MSAPLAKTDEIVLIGGQDRTTAEVSKLCGTLPPAVSALTGVDINAVGDLSRKNKVIGPSGDLKQGPLASIHNTTSRPQTQIKLGSAFHMH